MLADEEAWYLIDNILQRGCSVLGVNDVRAAHVIHDGHGVLMHIGIGQLRYAK